MNKNNTRICVVGAGLAGSECALALANNGYTVELYEMKPNKKTPAHHSNGFGEIVCSNSFKNKSLLSASGLLKHELEMLSSPLLSVAKECEVPAGAALAIDRELFEKKVTELIKSNKNITVNENYEVDKPFDDAITVFATGPLTSQKLEKYLQGIFGKDNLHFFDASAPIVDAASVNMNIAYYLGRYGKDNDYLNCPMTKDEYLKFYNELVNAKSVILKDFEKGDVFEGCMPIEVLAKRGEDAMRFGPLKPKGLANPKTGKEPYAVVQLRKENMQANSFGLVGFQTNLTFSEQKRVFSLIPGLENAEFIKYGVMHRNSFVCAPEVFDKYFNLKHNKNVYLAGQLTGVEGYVESIAAGHVVAMEIHARLSNKNFSLNLNTMIGALAEYVHISQKSFQPMNANYGIMPDITSENSKRKLGKDEKAEQRLKQSEIEIKELKEIINWE